MRRKMTGLEAGHVGVFDYVLGAPVVSTAQVRTGGYALQIGSWAPAHGVAWYLADRPNEIYMRIAVYITGGSATYHVLTTLYDSSGTTHLTVGFDPTTKGLQVRRGNYNGTLLATGAIADLNTWYCYELHAVIDDAAGVVQIKRDGTLEIDESGIDTRNAGNGDIYKVSYGRDHFGGQGIYGYYDDLVINDTSGVENNSWPGRGGIYLGEVDGAGAHTEFTPDSGANWERVKDIPPDDDTSYVESSVYGHRDLYTIAPIAPADGIISAVQVVARAKLTDQGIGNINLMLRHNGADDASADKGVYASYRHVGHIWERAPDDTAWSVAKVNALQIGQQVS